MATRHGSCPAPDDDGLGDFRSMGDMRADASKGSRELLKALRRMNRRAVIASRPRRKHSRARKSYGTFEDRQLAKAQVERLQRTVAEHFGIPVATMTGKRGSQAIAGKRQIAMYLAREVIRCSYPDIGKCFGGRDHTTVIHACQTVESNPELASLARFLRERIAV
jgi:chromosomal replication initiator protein